MNFKRYFYITLGIIATLLLFIAGTVVAVDPYQRYHKCDKFISHQRLANPGIARHHDYDAIIMGSSMSMNHYPYQVDSLFGWNSINLSTEGSLDYDYCIQLPYIAMQKKAKHMIWEIDFFSFALPPTITSELYLYDDKWWNDTPYWLSYTSCKWVINKLLNWEDLNSKENMYHFEAPLGKEILAKYYTIDNYEKYIAQYDFDNMTRRFDSMLNFVMPTLEDVQIYVYFPPYSILEFKMFEQYNHWNQIIDFKRYMIERLLTYPNVRLYDFQNEELICNLDEYMDLRHHSHAYNRRIVEYIHGDSCRVQEKSYQENLAILDSLVRNYTLDPTLWNPLNQTQN